MDEKLNKLLQNTKDILNFSLEGKITEYLSVSIGEYDFEARNKSLYITKNGSKHYTKIIPWEQADSTLLEYLKKEITNVE